MKAACKLRASVLECAGPPALLHRAEPERARCRGSLRIKSGRGLPHSKTLARFSNLRFALGAWSFELLWLVLRSFSGGGSLDVGIWMFLISFHSWPIHRQRS